MDDGCSEPGDDLIAFVQGELDADRRDAVALHLDACPACAQEAGRIQTTLETARTVRRDDIEPPAGLLGSILEQLDEAPPAPPRPWGRPSRSLARLGSVAALLLVCFAAGVLLFSERKSRPASSLRPVRLAWADGEVFFHEGGGKLERLPPGTVRPRQGWIRSRGTALMHLGPDVRVALHAGTLAFVRNGVRLSAGALAADVQPGHPFSIQTPAGEVRVRGTRFRVETAASGTSVEVLEGHVEMGNRAGRLVLGRGERGAMGPETRPRREGVTREAAWASPLDAREVLLELRAPDPGRPGLLEFRLANLSDRSLRLPLLDPDRYLFSLKIRSGPGHREGVANLARFRVFPEGSGPIPIHPGPALLLPGRSVSAFFDVSDLLSAPGDYELRGVYQAVRNGFPGAWVGQAVSRERTISH